MCARRSINKNLLCGGFPRRCFPPAAAPFLEEMAQKARIETGKHFGNTVYLFTPCILPIIARITVYTAASTAITTSTV